MMALNPLQTVLPLLSDLARFREEPGGFAIRLEGLDLEWEGRHIRFLGGEVRLSASSSPPTPAVHRAAGSPALA